MSDGAAGRTKVLECLGSPIELSGEDGVGLGVPSSGVGGAIGAEGPDEAAAAPAAGVSMETSSRKPAAGV